MRRQPEPEYMDLHAEAQAYADADFNDVNEAFVARLMELAGHLPDARALDLGTGPADIPARVLRERPRWRIVATDAAFAMLAIGRREYMRRGLMLVQADAKRLPFVRGAFQVIFSNSILHHITGVDAFWREVRRAARPGAVVLLRDLARPESEDAARAIVETYAGGESSLLQEEFYRSLLSAYTPAEVTEQLRRNDIRTLRVAMVSDRHLDVYGILP